MIFRLCAAAFLAALALAGGVYAASRADPVVRRATIALPDWPRGAAPVRVLLMADIHLGNASMDRARLERIVGQAGALKPDLVLVAGDFLAEYDKSAAAERSVQAAEALAALHAPLGTVAVLGNHDYATAPMAVANTLRRAGIVVLRNEAVTRGPLAIGGLGDGYSGNARVAPMLAAMQGLAGARVVVAHTPADAAKLPGDIALVLSGHTHCGQVVLPIVGAIAVPSVPRRYLCGVIAEPGRIVVVTAGLGTSTLPVRLDAPPDLWLLTLGPAPLAMVSPPRP